MKTAKINQHAERAVAGSETEILQNGMVAHVAFCDEGRPVVIPFSYHYDRRVPDRIYLHGSLESRALKIVASGVPVCVEVTLLDGLIYSRSAKYHSMNYRSVVCFGSGRVVDEAEKAELFREAVKRYFPDREAGRDYMESTVAQLRATAVVEIRIAEWSAKVREGGPKGPQDANPNAPGTCGVIALREL